MKRIYDGDFSQLRKIINSWNLISGSQDDEFDSLNNKILSELYKNADVEKIDRILQSELISTYGLFSNEFNSEIFVNQIMNWWNSK
ncbi:hypothetical protein PQ459_07010 [Chryseobacterium sp. KACC 21268]|nr:hypothetical protein PQ459_07010 [Chryseobacterium sp. KACC 21268]